MDEIYEEIAKTKPPAMVFETRRSRKIYIAITSDDHELLRRWQKALGLGHIVEACGPGSWYGDTRTTAIGGRWEWAMREEEAYTFSKGILPFLRRFWPYKHVYCQGLINVYESRQHQHTT
jgi:hypothetical protein